MKTLKAIIAGNRLYFAFWGLFFIVGLILLLTVGKAASFVDLNPYHQTTLDSIFIWVTFGGDGLFSVIVIVIFLFMRRWSAATQVTAAFLLSALIAQLLKNAFSMPRPMQFFAPGTYPYFIKNVTHLGFASFPSGHTTSIFALATMLALFTSTFPWRCADGVLYRDDRSGAGPLALCRKTQVPARFCKGLARYYPKNT